MNEQMENELKVIDHISTYLYIVKDGKQSNTVINSYNFLRDYMSGRIVDITFYYNLGVYFTFTVEDVAQKHIKGMVSAAKSKVQFARVVDSNGNIHNFKLAEEIKDNIFDTRKIKLDKICERLKTK